MSPCMPVCQRGPLRPRSSQVKHRDIFFSVLRLCFNWPTSHRSIRSSWSIAVCSAALPWQVSDLTSTAVDAIYFHWFFSVLHGTSSDLRTSELLLFPGFPGTNRFFISKQAVVTTRPLRQQPVRFCIYSQIKEFGALVFAATMNVRQVVSILVSYAGDTQSRQGRHREMR